MAAVNSIFFLNITLENLDDNAKVFEILRHFKPGWVLGNLECERFHGGVVNEMKMFYQQTDVGRDDAVVVRVFNDHLGSITPRRTEFLALQIAHAAGCFPTIHASFKNGVMYKYAKGRMPDFKDLLKPEVIADITSKMYRLSKIDMDSLTLVDQDGAPAKYDGGTDMFSRAISFLNGIPKEVADPDRNNAFQNLRQKFNDEMLLAEFDFVKQVYDEVDIPMVFSHGDTHLRNMVINDVNGEVTFLDFEVTGFNYEGWDLSNLLSMRPLFDALGWADKSEPDISEATRLLYIKGYLTAMFKSLGKEPDQISDLDIEFLDLQMKLVDLLMYCYFIVGGLGMVVLPHGDILSIIPVAYEKYMSLKYSINDIKTRYLELKKMLPPWKWGRWTSDFENVVIVIWRD